ncbi:E3 ubiquitin-protein ligase TRIM39-like [Pseudonaja textilis]|uniref:E3 ubiquitin-protein ligase TRIM39-like n=1 Tax=Pseudonaja textilis TaxID=8673 RepID=UPI000EA8626B|nr:E3 ubiquitin-protein ligase TRIM39-like [Pseudonaja textilis]
MSQEITGMIFCSEVICSICLEYFRDPVILQCGHNFCHDCIIKYWREFVLKYICPQCKMVAETETVLPNKSLEKMARLLEKLKQEARGKEVCEKHQAPWEYFCRNHQAPFCKWCAGSKDHEGHVRISLEQATKEFKDYFREILLYIENQKSVILKHKIGVEKESFEVIKGMQTLRKETEDTFEELHRFLYSEEHTQAGKIGEVQKNAIQKREERMDELFQEFASCDKMMRELQKKCSQQTNGFLQQAVITLDKETAHPLLILSEDCKSVTLGNKEACFAKSNKRFDMSHSVLGCEEFKEGRSYWDISMGKEGDWTVGVARKSVRRKNAISIEPRNGIWAIGKRGNDYFVLDPPNYSRLQPTGELRRVRVFLNCAGKHVSFFDADEATLLYHTYTSTISKEAFVPFFHLFHKAVLTLTP